MSLIKRENLRAWSLRAWSRGVPNKHTRPGFDRPRWLLSEGRLNRERREARRYFGEQR